MTECLNIAPKSDTRMFCIACRSCWQSAVVHGCSSAWIRAPDRLHWLACVCMPESKRQRALVWQLSTSEAVTTSKSRNVGFLVLVLVSRVWHHMTRTQPTSSLPADGPKGCRNGESPRKTATGAREPLERFGISHHVAGFGLPLICFYLLTRTLGSRIRALLFSPP